MSLMFRGKSAAKLHYKSRCPSAELANRFLQCLVEEIPLSNGAGKGQSPEAIALLKLVLRSMEAGG